MELVARLGRSYGYTLTRQSGSHLRLVSYHQGYAGYVSIPRHNPVKIGTLSNILNDVATYLEIDRDELTLELFG